jgi:hypothetical protein
MKDKILDWWHSTGIRQVIRNTIKGIENVIYWFPVIWKDRDWDHYYIYEILKTKLEKQATNIYNSGNHVDSKYDAERMFLCARLIQLQQEELYEYEWADPIYDENLEEYFKKYPRQYKRAISGEFDRPGLEPLDENNKDLIAMEIALENQKRSRKLLFKILDQNITRWWD